jgi:hypothetical protein
MANRPRRFLLYSAAALAAALLAVPALGSAASATSKPDAGAAASAKPAKINPFTGKPTTNYVVKQVAGADVTYYQWEYHANSAWCAEDPGYPNGTGAGMELHSCESATNFYWAPIEFGSGDWAGYDEMRNDDGLCIDDAGGADNVQIVMENCAEVGGQSWDGTFDPSDGSTIWLNAIAINANKRPYQAVTLDYGTMKDFAWIVTNNYSYNGTYPTDMQWLGP